jgi:hypothetical protein
MGSTAGPQTAAVLTGWKEIARYMGKGVRTVQRWEQYFGLPVRRALGSDKRAVLARPRDLDQWVAARCETRIDGDRRREHVELDRTWSLLQQRIELAKTLCRANQKHRAELQTAIRGLRHEICRLHPSAHNGSASAPHQE